MRSYLLKKQFILLAALFVMLGQVIAPANIALATSNKNGGENQSVVTASTDHEKVWVCKYAATPNVGEKAQTVISVDWQPDREPGMAFNDAQGLSYVLSYDTGQPKPSNNECPTLIAVPAAPSVTDPCGSGNAVWNVPADTDQLDWTLAADGTLSVSAKAGYMFIDGTFVHSYGLAPETNTTACPVTKIPIPAIPSVTDTCNVDMYTLNATWNVPADTDQLDWTLAADGTLSVTILTQNTTFNDGTTTHSYGLATQFDNKIVCAPTTAPTKSDTCGLKNDTYTIPAAQGIEYKVNGVVVAAGTYTTSGASSVVISASATTGYELQGDALWTLTFTNQRCTPDVAVNLATYCDAEGQNFYFEITNPTDSQQRYVLVVTDTNGTEVERSETFVLDPGLNTSGSWTTATDGTYTFSVYAVDDEGMVMGEALWQRTVETQCAHDVFTPNIFKVDQAGNKFTGPLFTVEVCTLGDETEGWVCKTYQNVNFGINGDWFKSNVEYKPYTPLKVSITETSTPEGCIGAGPWSATWSYSSDSVDRTTALEGAWTGDFTTNEWMLKNTCTPGKGGVDPTPTPVVKTGITVEELPHTGPSSSLINSVAALLLALTTYVVVYLAQPRVREQE